MAIVIIVIIIVAIVAIFSVQNAAPVAIAFMSWRFESSLAVVVFLSVVAGIIIGSVVTLLVRMQRGHKNKASVPGEQPPQQP